MEQKFSLSYENVKNLPFDKYQNDFTFYVNGKAYPTSRVVADILSPSIRRMHYLDSMINEFSFEANCTKEDSNADYFNDFLRLASFDNSAIDPARQKCYQEYFYKLGNIDAYFQLQPAYVETLSCNNVVERLLEMSKSIVRTENETISTPSIIHQMVKFASMHFEDIDKEEMKRLPKSMIDDILSSDALVLSDEDSLLSFVLSLYEGDVAASNLFEHVLFKNVSDELLSRFVDEFSVEHINSRIWESISRRLVRSRSESDGSEEGRYAKASDIRAKESNIRAFERKEGDEFDGIMRYLTRKTGGNIHDNQTVNITSNSINGSSQHPKNLVDYENTNCYQSRDDGGAFVCFDFKDKSVKLESYSIQSRDGDENFAHLKNWVIEVSDDGEHWSEVDRRENDSTLRGRSIKANFVLKSPKDAFTQHIRLRQTGNSWYSSCNHNYIGFCHIEFYGKLQEPSK